MKDVLPAIEEWRAKGDAVALATVVRAYGSAPRREGAKMAVSSEGDLVGSVSGGCLEADVFEHAQLVLKGGEPELLKYGVTDDMAFEVGLACGGQVEINVEPLLTAQGPAPLYEQVRQAVADDRGCALATVVRGPNRGAKLLVYEDGATQGSLGNTDLDRQVAAQVPTLLDQEASRLLTLQVKGEEALVFVDVIPPAPKMLVLGAVHVAIPLVEMAKILGFHVTLIDPRRKLANRERFPEADRIIIAYPDEGLEQVKVDSSTCIVMLTHDAKFDDPALKAALKTRAKYVGAIGSKRTNLDRNERLRANGVSDEDIARIHGPIGLDIGAITPEETAVSILAEVVAARHGRAGARPMREALKAGAA